jgi:RNA polymerase sigma-70 factor (ECF subfamily)
LNFESEVRENGFAKEEENQARLSRQKSVSVTLEERNRVKSGSEHETTAPRDWDQWLSEQGPVLLLFARQQARCEADAQDLVQEAVVESWRRQGNGEPPPVGMVYATIRRRAVDLARKQDRRTNREIVATLERPQCWFDSGLEERERNDLLQGAMKELPLIYREVVVLKVWGGITFAEIAAALEIPANTAASRYRYGLAELRKLTKGVLE